jgi:K+-sensing histidine kinase KdpD
VAVLDKELESAILRDLMLVSEKIELHIQPNIAEYVRAKAQAGSSGITADSASLWAVIQGIVTIDKYENVRQEGSEEILLRGSWVFWDLMLANVIANAIEAAKPSGGTISISAHRIGSKLSIDVVNEGDHVPEGIRDKLFEWGVTTKKPTVNPLTGNVNQRGNGLYVAQQIAIGLGGRILPPENLTVRRSLLSKNHDAVKFSIVDLNLGEDL